MSKRREWLAGGLALVVALLGVGCATTTVSVPFQQPPAVHLAGVRKLAIVPVQARTRYGRHSQVAGMVTGKLAVALTQARQFEVVERELTEAMLREYRLAGKGRSAADWRELGQMLQADAMLTGDVTVAEMQERCERHENEKKVWYTYTREAEVRVDLRIVAFASGANLEAASLRATASGSSDSGYNAIASDGLFEQAARSIAEQYAQRFRPQAMLVQVRLDRGAGPLREAMAPAVELVATGRLQEARAAFKDLAAAHPGASAPVQALAVVCVALDELDEAEHYLQLALADFPRSVQAETTKADLRDYTALEPHIARLRAVRERWAVINGTPPASRSTAAGLSDDSFTP